VALAPGLGWSNLTEVNAGRACVISSQRDIASYALTLTSEFRFKLKQTAHVRKLIARRFGKDEWVEAGQGWQGLDTALGPATAF
jgi:hypothetical protein